MSCSSYVHYTYQEINLSGCSSLWTLPDSLVDLSKLKYLHIPTRTIAEEIVHQLEFRRPLPVLVDADSDDEKGTDDYEEEGLYYMEDDWDDSDDDEDDYETDYDWDGAPEPDNED
jgi:hypothetical protein